MAKPLGGGSAGGYVRAANAVRPSSCTASPIKKPPSSAKSTAPNGRWLNVRSISAAVNGQFTAGADRTKGGPATPSQVLGSVRLILSAASRWRGAGRFSWPGPFTRRCTLIPAALRPPFSRFSARGGSRVSAARGVRAVRCRRRRQRVTKAGLSMGFSPLR